jgi:hypothetical protein
MHSVPRHVRERAGGLFLDGFNGGEFEPLLVGGDFVFVAHVEIVAWHIHQALLVGVSQKLATREAEGQSIFLPSFAGATNSRSPIAEPTRLLLSFRAKTYPLPSGVDFRCVLPVSTPARSVMASLEWHTIVASNSVRIAEHFRNFVCAREKLLELAPITQNDYPPQL